MTDWTDTAKRMAASPKWVWRNGMHWTTDSDDYGIVGWLRDPPEPDAYPQLQGWAMTGIILGTVMEICGAPRLECTRTGRWFAAAGIETVFATKMYLYPGQALGELWLELVA